jgi:hypothetical protein
VKEAEAVGGRGNQRIPRTPAESGSSKFNDTTCLKKKKKWRVLKEDP